MAATGYPAASPLGPVRHAAAAAPDAAGALYDRSAARVYRFCHRIVSDADAAEDAVQATLVAALAALGTGFDVEADSSWLLALAETTCRLGTHHARVSRAGRAGPFPRWVPARSAACGDPDAQRIGRAARPRRSVAAFSRPN